MVPFLKATIGTGCLEGGTKSLCSHRYGFSAIISLNAISKDIGHHELSSSSVFGLLDHSFLWAIYFLCCFPLHLAPQFFSLKPKSRVFLSALHAQKRFAFLAIIHRDYGSPKILSEKASHFSRRVNGAGWLLQRFFSIRVNWYLLGWNYRLGTPLLYLLGVLLIKCPTITVARFTSVWVLKVFLVELLSSYGISVT